MSDKWNSSANGGKDAWAELAGDYMKMAQAATFQTGDLFLEDLNALRPFDTATAVLDNGAGPGPVLDRLFANYERKLPKDVQLLAADRSPAMVEQLKKQVAAGEARWGKVDVQELDAMDLKTIKDGTMSHVVAGFVYFMVDDPQKALAESKRVLEDGGVLGLSSWNESEWMNLLDTVRDVRPDKAPMWGTIPQCWRSQDGVKKEFEKAGFKDVRSRNVLVHMYYDDAAAICRFFLEKLPNMQTMLKDVTKEEVDEMVRRMADKLHERHGKGPGEMWGVAISTVGRK